MKKLLLLIIASMTTSLLLYVLVSMDQPARHPVLEATELPPLLSLHDFYGAPDGNQEKTLSTAGTKIAWQQPNGAIHELAAQLSLPQTKSNPGPLPTLILVNTRPIAETGLDDNRKVQFLANRGYVVLSIECGDNSAIDNILAENALQRSGRCTENDIADRARQLVDQGIADPAALAIIGSGCGGYIALMTMSLEPGLFKAAIVHSAVTDQGDYFCRNPLSMKPQPALVKTCLSHLDLDQGAQKRTGQSPIDLVNRIQGAVLITHSKADTVVSIKQTQAYARELLNAGKDVEIVYFNHEDHNYYRWQTRVQVARLTESFLARHLGGRNGGYDYIELMAKLF